MANLYLGSRKFVPAFYNDEGGSATLITKSITQNGTYNASSDNADGYSSVTVNVSGGSGYSELPSYQVSNGVASKRSGALTGNEFSGITSVGTSALSHAFEGCSGLTGTVNLSSLTTIGDGGLYYAFYNCSGLASINLSSLTTIGDNGLQYAFVNCENLASVDLSSLTTVGNSGLNFAFNQCYVLESVDLSSLTTVGNYGLYFAFQGCNVLTGDLGLSSLTSVGNYGLSYAFADCENLASINLSSLTTIGDNGLQYAFANCGGLIGTVDFSSLTSIDAGGLGGAFADTKIEHIYFRALTSDSFADDTVFDRMLGSVDDATVHFPSNLEEIIGDWESVTSGFEGVNTTVLFDLPATE